MSLGWRSETRLSARSRAATLTVACDNRAAIVQVLLLLGLGLLTGLVRCFVDLSLGVPGHSIVLIMVPVAFGVAATRRRGAGTVTSASALATVAAVGCLPVRVSMGVGAIVSLFAAGPALDIWLSTLHRRHVYTACVAAGVSANLVALCAKIGLRTAGLYPGIQAAAFFDLWLHRATITYPLCGAVAGLLAAAVCFSMRDRTDQAPDAARAVDAE